MAVRWSCTDIDGGIVDHQGVCLGQEGNSLGVCSVPSDSASRARDTLVHGNSVGGGVGSAGSQNVDGGGSDGQAGVVPGKGDVLANFVVGRRGVYVGCDQSHATVSYRVAICLCGCGR